ncbi:MAG: PfkB family carbohydrate kinase [Gemmataceae bacterium]|nr:PfkB family carbohydrate kinase [Gemmataceae bacterium]
MLSDTRLQSMLDCIPSLALGVLGDLFLDRYLEIDAALTEPSLETGLAAYQVVRVRPSPGAAGTVINNLAALGVQRVHALSVIGDDGEGYELRRALHALRCVDSRAVFSWEGRRTPTYTKPMLHQQGQPPRELNRLDLKNRTPLPAAAEDRLWEAVVELWPHLDALLVLDQVSEPDCGVVSARLRARLGELGEQHLDKLILADSRERIGLFQSVWLKPNQTECLRAVASMAGEIEAVPEAARQLAQRTQRPVFCTCGAQGIVVAEPRPGQERTLRVPAYPVHGPIDIVGAGDSTSAGIACAVAAGASLEEAAAFGNLVASITIQQLGTTGTASPEQIRQRWREVSGNERP